MRMSSAHCQANEEKTMFNYSLHFDEWMLVQLSVMLFSLLTLGRYQSRKVQCLLLGSIIHASLSTATLGLWLLAIRLFM